MKTLRQSLPAQRNLSDLFTSPSVLANMPSIFQDGPFRHFPEWFRDDGIAVEEFREGKDIVIRADLPGVDPAKDVEISVVDGVLHIRAERRHQEEEAGRDYYRSELRYGAFERSLPLPTDASAEDVTASYGDGVLEVRVAAPEAKSSKTTIPVARS